MVSFPKGFITGYIAGTLFFAGTVIDFAQEITTARIKSPAEIPRTYHHFVATGKKQ
jgi:hypothetical protein